MLADARDFFIIMWEDACASSLSKIGLGKLIEELKLIHGAM